MTTVASLQPQRRPSLSLRRPNPGPGGRSLVLLMQVQEKTEEIFRPPTSFVQTRKKPRFLLRRRRRVLYNLRSISSVIHPNHTEQIVPTTSLCFCCRPSRKPSPPTWRKLSKTPHPNWPPR